MNSSETLMEQNGTEVDAAANDEMDLEARLQELKSLDLDSARVALYVCHVKPNNEKKRFTSMKELPLSDDLKAELREYVRKCVDGNNHIAELLDVNSEQNNRFFYVESHLTDFTYVGEQLSQGLIYPIQDINDLADFNSYAIQLIWPDDNESLFAFRYLSGQWSTKARKKTLISKIKQNSLVAEITSDPVFVLESHIDFIEFNDGIFIDNVNKFQTAMGYKARLEQKREEALQALGEEKVLGVLGKEALGKMVSKDTHFMKQLASVYALGYYANPEWMAKLRKVLKHHKNVWRLKLDDQDRLVVEQDKQYIKELLTILQNKRVRSVVDDTMWDVDGALELIG